MYLVKKSFGEKLFDIFNILILIVFSLTCIYPIWHEICLSFSSISESLRGGFFLWPREFTVSAYQSIFRTSGLTTSFKNSVIVTVIGTALSVILTAATAYPLTKKFLLGHRVVSGLILFTMLFGGGLIPTYLLVKSFRMVNTLWALIIPGCISAYNVFVMMSFFRSLPIELEESAFIDGANPVKIFFLIVLPLSMPVLATVSLWEAVGQWNNFFGALIYLNNQENFTLPIFVRQVISGSTRLLNEQVEQVNSNESVVAATIMVSIAPVLCLYPFLQKYFIKGVMLGSIKG